MANRAYVSAWAQADLESSRLEKFGRLLETFPFSATWKGFTGAIVRAVELAETPLREWDLRSRPFSAEEVIELVREQDGADIAYEVEALWDLWTYDAEKNQWTRGPQKVEIACYGEEFEGGIATLDGDYLIDLGFEHLFTGHGHLLGDARKQSKRRAHHAGAPGRRGVFGGDVRTRAVARVPRKNTGKHPDRFSLVAGSGGSGAARALPAVVRRRRES